MIPNVSYGFLVFELDYLRFLSNPDQPGCEKLAVRKIPKEFLEREYFEMASLDGVLTV